MTSEEVHKFIPSSFVIANHTITVDVLDEVADGKTNAAVYGNFQDVCQKIRLATHVDTSDAGLVELSEEQIRNSYWHEWAHMFMFFAGMSQDEMIAQAFANIMREYETSKMY